VFDQGRVPFEGKPPVAIVLDGQILAAPRAGSGERVWRFRKTGATWEAALPADPSALAKRHGLQGPIDDAFMDSFLFVRPTGTALHTNVAGWVAGEMNRAIGEWRRQFRGDARVKNDTAVTRADIAEHNLVLWGDPRSNRTLAGIAGKLPVRWTTTGVTAGGTTYPSDSHVPVLVYPNPLNPKRYVVINSGFTWREYDYLNNARQTPKLPDWAVVDIRTPVTPRAPGAIVAAGFFGERWEVR
ncbi:MAG: hypothetical protein KJ579_04195, partial [Verrucomicrobia bacterium]|nr:hypothetical protein [Verrucomicrobiota bacterium]